MATLLETTQPLSQQTLHDGSVVAHTRLTPTDDKTRGSMVVPPTTVVPVVFVPGVMGSNLKARKDIVLNNKTIFKAGQRVWKIDSITSPMSLWGEKPAYRQVVMNKDALAVDNRGKIAQGYKTERTSPWLEVPPTLIATETTPISELPVETARKRGWGTPGWHYYGSFLDWLEYQLDQGRLVDGKPNSVFQKLSDLAGSTPQGAKTKSAPLTEDQIKKMLDIRFPVYAVGYNWLQSNMDSGRDLAKGTGSGEGRVLGIEEIIKQYDNVNGQSCPGVIVVTHSMGGLVARAAALEYGAKILGIVHGVQPIDGAAAFYKRIAAGFEGEGSGIVGSAIGYVTAKILGPDSRYTIPELAYSSGPLELAPNQLYNGGKPWLFIKDRQGHVLKALPEHGDPYDEIYLDTTHVWRAVNPEWLNPAGKPGNALFKYAHTVKKAQSYHEQLGGKLHPHTYAHWGNDDEYKSWGSMTWVAVAGETYKPSVWAKATSRGMAREQWVPNRQQNLSGPNQWSFQEPVTEAGAKRDVLSADNKEIHMTVEDPTNAGDGTVPAEASGARIALYPGCQIGCALTGFVHQDDYKNAQVRNVLLDALVRLVEPIKVT